jgi:uncharacterized membrane protein YwaF
VKVGETMTFEMWSSSHYLFMFLPFIFLSVLFVFTKDRTREANRRIGIVLSVFAIIILILRNIEIWIGKSYRFDVELIPLQICHFANFVLLIALLTNRQTWFNFALILNLPAAMVSMIFANSLTNYSTIISFRGFAYIMGHALLVVIPLWLFMTGFVVLDQRIFKKTLVLVGLLYAGSVVLNNLMFVLFGQYSNYFYTMKPEKGTPLETFFDLGRVYHLNDFRVNPLYLLLTAILGFIVMITVYSGFSIVKGRTKRAVVQTKRAA